MTAYFERLGPTSFRATEHTGGAWALDEQHIAPALGLLAHCAETAHTGPLVLGRLSYDILGTVAVDVVDVAVSVVRPGRTIELLEATMSYAGRAVVRLRAWLLQPGDTSALAGTTLEPIPGPDECEPWDPTTVWPGGFIASAVVRRRQLSPGRATFWVRTEVPLLADEPVSARARAAGLLDIANGMTVRVSPREVAFPNVDLTAHLVREPVGEWLGFDTSVTFSATGLGLTTSVLHDTDGPLGVSSQLLTVRPG